MIKKPNKKEDCEKKIKLYKYGKEGEIVFSVYSINIKDKCNIVIKVKDTGKGIKAENINKLFTKFERLDAETN